jgi:SAM-dependent methyltransferase
MAASLHKSRRRFDAIFARIAESETLSAIWREVYREDYPRDATPFSFVTIPELRWLATALNVDRGRSLVDLACGRGGPGLWVAKEAGAALIGIDASVVAIAAASATARHASSAAAFVVADAAATGLRAGSVDAVMSVDALQLMPHRAAVLDEVARVLKSRGRFAFTTWLSRGGGAAPPFPADYQPLLSAAGFVVEACHEPVDWRRRELAVFAGIRENAVRLRAELGEEVSSMFLAEAEKMPDAYHLIRRVNVMAMKSADHPQQQTSGAHAGAE